MARLKAYSNSVLRNHCWTMVVLVTKDKNGVVSIHPVLKSCTMSPALKRCILEENLIKYASSIK